MRVGGRVDSHAGVPILITQRNVDSGVVTIWLAQDATLVGSVQIRPRALPYDQVSTIRYVEIVGLTVDPGSRRKGLGRQLVQAAVEWAREHGFERVAVESTANWDKPGPPFYEALGFTARSIVWDMPVGLTSSSLR